MVPRITTATINTTTTTITAIIIAGEHTQYIYLVPGILLRGTTTVKQDL